MDDLRRILKNSSLGFLERSIARELTDKLLDANPVGEIILDAACWANDWNVHEKKIWEVIDFLDSMSFWSIVQDANASRLKCGGIASSAKAINRAKKRNVLQSVKQTSHVDRAKSLSLEKTNPSLVSEVVDKIAASDRSFALNRGYEGWLPSSGFGIDGMVFRPSEGLKQKLRKDVPNLDVDRCFAEMYDDLKSNFKARPTMTSFPFWINQWIKQNSDRLIFERSESEKKNLISAKMDDY